MSDPLDEARLIVDQIKQEWGPIYVPGDRAEAGPVIDGKQAIIYMQQNQIWGWRESEWPHYFIKGILREKLTPQFQIKRDKKFVYLERDFPWDIRIHATSVRSSKVSLGDCKNVENFFASHSGYGLIVITVIVNTDLDHQFREWLIQQKGISQYVLKKEREGARKWRYKTVIFLLSASAYYFTSLTSFQQGLTDGWLSTWANTAKNANDIIRKPKYQIDLSKITPLQCWPINDESEFEQEDDDIDDLEE